ncbi:hypothetical protein HY623_01580 [Candidatus Uhrbacteria bacterium]|nr:hypothetical protein [Candidatus Uhrbacteria bacterium]
MNINDQHALSDKELKKSYWLVVHAGDIRMWSTRVGAGAVIIIVLIAIISLASAVIGQFTRAEYVVSPLLANANRALPMVVLDVPRIVSSGAIDRGSGIYDLYAVVENSHARWRADIEVIFTVGGSDQLPVRTFVFPGDKKYVLLYGIASVPSQLTEARVEHTAWKRLTDDERARANERKSIRISGFNYESGRTAGGEILTGSRARFVLENTGVYDFFDFPLQVILMHGSSPVAAGTIPVFSLRRNQKLPLEARWDYIFAANEYDIIPDIDLFEGRSMRPAL